MIHRNSETTIQQARELEDLAEREAAGQPSPPLYPRRRYASAWLPATERLVDEVPLSDSETL